MGRRFRGGIPVGLGTKWRAARPKILIDAGEGDLRSVSVVQTANRTRLVMNLNRTLSYTQSLDGKWRIAMAKRPEEVPAGFHADGYDTSGWREVSVPHTWQTDGLDHPIFRNIATEVQPDSPPKIPRDVNPTGAYVRTMGMKRARMMVLPPCLA